MDYKKVEAICKKYKINNWSLEDGLVNVDDNVILRSKHITKLPLNFGKVSGYFECSWNKLTSLKGAPHHVGGFFNCNDNSLINLDYMPKHIGTFSLFNSNNLYEVTDIPTDFYIENNPVYYLYQYITDIDDEDFMSLKVSLDYFNDYKIQVGTDIYVDRFKAFLESYGLESDIDVEMLKYYGYTIK